MGIASLIMGIVGILICWIPVIGFFSCFLVLAGLVLGIVDLCKKAKKQEKKGISIAGTVVCAVAIPITIMVAIISFGTWIFYTAQESGVIEEAFNTIQDTIKDIPVNEYYEQYEQYYNSIYSNDAIYNAIYDI